MNSDNPSGGDNQQETASSADRPHPFWVCGFVDGEGCFSVSIHKNPHVQRTRGWQLNAVFQVSQHERYRSVLEELVSFFGCGRVRSKGPRSCVLVYAVDRLKDLEDVILPFFETHPLYVKKRDFDLFVAIVRAMRKKEHLDADGFGRIVRLAFMMNEAGKQRSKTLEDVLAGSSETTR